MGVHYNFRRKRNMSKESLHEENESPFAETNPAGKHRISVEDCRNSCTEKPTTDERKSFQLPEEPTALLMIPCLLLGGIACIVVKTIGAIFMSIKLVKNHLEPECATYIDIADMSGIIDIIKDYCEPKSTDDYRDSVHISGLIPFENYDDWNGYFTTYHDYEFSKTRLKEKREIIRSLLNNLPDKMPISEKFNKTNTGEKYLPSWRDGEDLIAMGMAIGRVIEHGDEVIILK